MSPKHNPDRPFDDPFDHELRELLKISQQKTEHIPVLGQEEGWCLC